jgi:predicted solute-binding protein
MLRGPQQNIFDLSFSVPSVCADRLESGDVDIGIVPCAELDRLGLDFLPDVGIACRGAVRSILLISKVPFESIRTLGADSSSRTSVMLARIILAERHGATPEVLSMAPDLNTMLRHADAALIIGDPALAIQPADLQWPVLDLGAEWFELTGLPMVFAVWAGRPQVLGDRVRQVFVDSCRFGEERIADIANDPEAARGFSPELVREYLTRYIRFQLGPQELEGLAAYRRMVSAFRLRDAELITTL